MDHVARALELNQSGYNCAQSVLCAFSDLTGLEEKTALALAAGLGGGLRSCEVCGAVSGAVLVLGALYPFDDSSDYHAKQRIAGLAREFCTRFRDKYGVLTCRELLEATTPEYVFISAAPGRWNSWNRDVPQPKRSAPGCSFRPAKSFHPDC